EGAVAVVVDSVAARALHPTWNHAIRIGAVDRAVAVLVDAAGARLARRRTVRETLARVFESIAGSVVVAQVGRRGRHGDGAGRAGTEQAERDRVRARRHVRVES